MKKFLMVCLAAAALLAFEQQRASAWVNSHLSIGLNWDYQSANNTCLWGLKRNYEPGACMPGPQCGGCPGGYCPSGYGYGYPVDPGAPAYPAAYAGHEGAPYVYGQPLAPAVTPPAQSFPPAPKTSEPAKSSNLGGSYNGYQNAGYYYYSGYYYNGYQPVGYSDMGYGYGQAPSYWYGR